MCAMSCVQTKMQMFVNVSMSRNVIADRDCKMATDLRAQLIERGRDCLLHTH